MPIIRDLAKDFLRPYIERGVSIEDLCKGHISAGDTQSCLQIGGQVEINGTCKEIGSDCLAITRFEGRPYLTTFSVRELYNEVRTELRERDRPRQQSLWTEHGPYVTAT